MLYLNLFVCVHKCVMLPLVTEYARLRTKSLCEKLACASGAEIIYTN